MITVVLPSLACGLLVVCGSPPNPVHGLDHRYGFSYQRTSVDHSNTRMSYLTTVRMFNVVLPISSGTLPQCASHGVMKFDREGILARSGSSLLSPCLVSARRGGRRGLADWLCSCTIGLFPNQACLWGSYSPDRNRMV